MGKDAGSGVVTFIVPGVPGAARGAREADAGTPRVDVPGRTVRSSVRVSALRDRSESTRVEARPGKDAVVLRIAGGPALVLHPETARELFLAQQSGGNRAARAAGGAPGEVVVSAELSWDTTDPAAAARGTSRGPIGRVLLSAIDVVTDLFVDDAATATGELIGERFDSKVDAGVYHIASAVDAPLKGRAEKVDLIEPTNDGPALVLVHGTFSETHGTFGKLWTQHPQRARALAAHYGGRMYALDHPTLTQSPIENALLLAKALPKGARVHLLTHSRGGLVAEVLARVCADPDLDEAALLPFETSDRKAQLSALRELAANVKGRGISVERVVRVACPARGTLLASKRLDAYVSVLKWTLELAGVPVVPALVEFLGAVALQRTKPDVLPGLEAMMPRSPLVRWLHAAKAPLPGQLRVVAGDVQGDSVGSWLKTLLSDGFFWTDNDFIVQTRSMYGGTSRAPLGAEAGATFVLDRGGKVSHFAYFSNERTAAAVCDALTRDQPEEFRPIGPLSWAGESSTGLRAPKAAGVAPADRPAVFVLPGILGSHLKAGSHRIWLSWRVIGGLDRIAYPDAEEPVTPDGPIGASYDDLIEFLGKTHEVIPFAFDWRRPIPEEARRLADALDAAMKAREGSGQPVRIVAHSMGGLVARTVQLERPEVWNRWTQRAGSRLLMLGTPNGGSWAPMQVLSGDDTFGNLLASVGEPFAEQEARQVMAGLPGFLQLQAKLVDGDLGQESAWRKLADRDLAIVRRSGPWHTWWYSDEELALAYGWGIPPQKILDDAAELRRRLDAQRDRSLAAFQDRLLLVVGLAELTPDGYDVDPEEGLDYLDARYAGDGRVTLASALLPGVRTWSVDCPHGDLADFERAFDAYLDLLTRGDTKLIATLGDSADRSGAARSQAAAAAPARVRRRPSRERKATMHPPSGMNSVFEVVDEARSATTDGTAPRRLTVAVTNGDLQFVSLPILVGHYVSSTLTGTERVVDEFIGKPMRQSLSIGLYPESAGTHQIFDNLKGDPENPWQLPRPQAVIVVGLGEENQLRASDLARTVRQGVLAWAQRVMESSNASRAGIDVAATLIGSGGIGHSAGTSAQAIARGVSDANEQLSRMGGDGWPQVDRLLLVERYLDRATDAWRSLKVLESAWPTKFDVPPTVAEGIGALRRPLDNSYRGAEYEFISAIVAQDAEGQTSIHYALDTKRARTEVRAQSTQVRFVRRLVKDASFSNSSRSNVGATLFQLLVPVEIEAFLSGSTAMLLDLDDGAAAIPWEILDVPHDGSSLPWSIRCRLLRKLRTADYRASPNDARTEHHVLVVGEPKCDLTKYPPLPGARAEAEAVHEVFASRSDIGPSRLWGLFGSGASEIIEALLDRDRPYRVVHVAGHGDLQTATKGDEPVAKGVILDDDLYIGAAEIRSMRAVPELVFLNCCHLGKGDHKPLEATRDPARFAAGVAGELIRSGVRCVVVAGWAVEDAAARTFATTFYRELLEGRRFMDAVTAARTKTFLEHPDVDTWAAYQCYGDPDWTWRPSATDAQRPSAPLGDPFAAIASADALRLALESVATESGDERRARIGDLERRFEANWGHLGSVAESFGHAFSAAGDTKRAIRWFERAVSAADGTSSLRAAEQLANLRVRSARNDVAAARKAKRPAKELSAVRRRARDEIEGATKMLASLLLLGSTIERESLMGSAFKRLAMIERDERRTAEERAALDGTLEHYRKAEDIARRSGARDLFYPAMNRMAAELRIQAANGKWKGFDAEELDAVRRSLLRAHGEKPDFWSAVALVELQMYEAFSARRLPDRVDELLRQFDDLKSRVPTKWMWGSPADQAEFLLPDLGGDPAEKAAASRVLEALRKHASS